MYPSVGLSWLREGKALAQVLTALRMGTTSLSLERYLGFSTSRGTKSCCEDLAGEPIMYTEVRV